MSDKSCRLCSTSSIDSCLNIFSGHSNEIGMVDILREHFKCEIFEADPFPNVVCQVCWDTTQAFDELYKKSKVVQEKFLNSLVKIEATAIDTISTTNNVEGNSNTVENFPIKIEVSSANNESDHEVTIDNANDSSIEYIGANCNGTDEENVNENIARSTAKKVSKKRTTTRKQSKKSKNTDREIVTDKEKAIQCNICREMFDSQRKLVYHKKTHQKDPYDKKVYEQFIAENFDKTCDQCDEKFNSFHDARQHYKDKHNENDGYIKCCGKKLRHLWMIHDHINTHLNPETFKCELCSRNFQSRAILSQHKRKHGLQKLICHFCGREFPNKEAITRHLFTKHVSSEPKFECQICKKKYQLQSLLKSHMWTVHREKKRSITCEQCGKSFYIKFHLDKHMLSSHTDKSERLVTRKQCEHCGEWLLTKSGIFYHKQLHTTGIQKCDHCGMEFPNRPSLLGHIRKYHRPHKFKCSYCEKTSSSKSDMRRHEESHTRNNIYTCEFCKSTFSVHSSLQTHLRRNHREQLKSKREAKNLT